MTAMKRHQLLVCATALFTLAAVPVALAKDAKKPKGTPSAVFAKYDADYNGRLNVEEGDAIRKDFAKNPNDPLLKPFDTDHDAALSDAEIMAIPATMRGGPPKLKQK